MIFIINILMAWLFFKMDKWSDEFENEGNYRKVLELRLSQIMIWLYFGYEALIIAYYR